MGEINQGDGRADRQDRSLELAYVGVRRTVVGEQGNDRHRVGRVAVARSQPSSKLARFYTVLIRELTFLAPVGCEDSSLLLGAWTPSGAEASAQLAKPGSTEGLEGRLAWAGSEVAERRRALLGEAEPPGRQGPRIRRS